jgi:opacity protein-like surface antigen
VRAQSRLRGVPAAWRLPWRRDAIAFSVPEASGYQLGGGVEHALTHNWHLKLEYRYGKNESQTVALAPGLNLNLEPTVQSVLLGASFHF